MRIASSWLAVVIVTALFTGVARSAPESAEVKASDGKTVRLTVYAPEGGTEGRAALVALSQMGRKPSVWAPLAERCGACGITLVAVDHRLTDAGVILGGNLTGEVEGAALDAAAAVLYTRETLGAPKDRVAFVGDGWGGQVAADAAEEDADIVALCQIGGSPGLVNLTLYSKGWDDRPMVFVINENDDKKDVRSALKMIAKEDWSDALVVQGSEGTTGSHLFGTVPGLEDRIIARVHAWLNRPELDGVPDEDPGDGAPATAHGRAAGPGGGILVHGYLDPAAGRLASVEVLVHPDPTATTLDETSRRIVLKPKTGRVLTATVEVFAWDGKRWKLRSKGVLEDSGGIVLGKERQTYEVWLAPHAIDVPPFSKVAVASTGFLGKQALWDGLPVEGAEPSPSGVDVATPSTWTPLELH